jgi:hypothetical protein
VRGYVMVFDVRDGSIQLLEVRRDHADWGIWTLGAASGLERREADAELVQVVLDRQRGREELVRVTGYKHPGNCCDEEGYFELLRVSSRRIERLFAGVAREDINLSERGKLTWRDRQYTYVNHDGTDEIRVRLSTCQRVLDVDPEAKKCRLLDEQTYRFGAQFVLVE